MLRLIIGHGRSPEGRGWGRRIDSADLVIRMWNCHWQRPSVHGRRYDYGVIETYRPLMVEFYQKVRRQPGLGWIASDVRNRVAPGTLPPRTEIVDQRRWTKGVGERIGGCGETGLWQLTRGGIAACWTISNSTAGDEVVLVGCDNLCAGLTMPVLEAFPNSYIRDLGIDAFQRYRPGVTKSGNHDFPAERKLIEYLAYLRGVTIGFAEEIW